MKRRARSIANAGSSCTRQVVLSNAIYTQSSGRCSVVVFCRLRTAVVCTMMNQKRRSNSKLRLSHGPFPSHEPTRASFTSSLNKACFPSSPSLSGPFQSLLPAGYMTLTQFTTPSSGPNESFVDVLIIGAGPAGLMCANGLASAKVNVRIIDKRSVKHFMAIC